MSRLETLCDLARAAFEAEDFAGLGAMDQELRDSVRALADVGEEAPDRLARVHGLVEELLRIHVAARERLEAGRGETGRALGTLRKGRRAVHAYGRG